MSMYREASKGLSQRFYTNFTFPHDSLIFQGRRRTLHQPGNNSSPPKCIFPVTVFDAFHHPGELRASIATPDSGCENNVLKPAPHVQAWCIQELSFKHL